MKFRFTWLVILTSIVYLSSCEDFLTPKQETNITESELFDDWYEYRASVMGLYSLQQDLVEQLMILGELRGDLLTITPNADADMVEIYNFNVSKTNKYASPSNFFKLISACNNFIRILKKNHPEILDPKSPVTNYDRLYGEALCMRTWAYFNAVRIYGKVPVIYESLTTIEEIDNYINSPGTYIDSVHIEFGLDGYHNDTLYNVPIVLEKNVYDLPMVVDMFTNQLENEVKAVGVNHYINNNDNTWEVTVWNTFAYHALLGQMYLTDGNYTRAENHFAYIMYNISDNDRYELDYSFAYGNWSNIFTNIDTREHIFTIWFNKANFQQNKMQYFFEPFGPNKYMLKPTKVAIDKWETVWRNQVLDADYERPMDSKMTFEGIPSDFYRGYGSSYIYMKGLEPIYGDDYMNMLFARAKGDDRTAGVIMEGVDTIVYKYSINKNIFEQDANFIVFRAAGIHLYMAELYTFWAFEKDDRLVTDSKSALNILNDGSNYDIQVDRTQMGVRGRVGLGRGDDAVRISDIIFKHDPYTNKIIGYMNFTNNLLAKQNYIEEQILDERARELAYEGERFYDLMRIAKRRNDPSFLAKAVSSKYPAGKREQIYNFLLDENNWYIKYFE